jgi:hypothetical protein
LRLLGAEFHIASNSRALIGLVEEAFGGLPAHSLSARSRGYQCA